MKHIALLLPGMRMGGAEKVCLNFLDYLIKEYKVTLILSKREGDLLPYIPKCVEIIEDHLYDFKEILIKDLKKFRFIYLLKDFVYYIKIKIGKNSERNYRYLISRTPARMEHYDCAIGYVANVSTQIFCLADRINADKKIAWIHGETTEMYDTELFAEYYKCFNKFYCVSEVTKNHFLKRFPECSKRTEVYYNHIRKNEILIKAQEPMEYNFDKTVTNIVTVGRVTPEKGMDMIPEIMCLLLKKGLKVHWYLIGDGTELEKIREDVDTFRLNENITLAGNKLNPYPFIMECDIYVQPSYEEGYSTTICEAGILGKAIIGTTTSGGIREQIEDHKNGLIVEPIPQALCDAIIMLINNVDLKKKLEENILLKDFSNQDEFIKLKNFISL